VSFAFGLVYRMLFDVRLLDPSCPYLVIRQASLRQIMAGNVGILKQGFGGSSRRARRLLGYASKRRPYTISGAKAERRKFTGLTRFRVLRWSI